jgi:hypothetical protein
LLTKAVHAEFMGMRRLCQSTGEGAKLPLSPREGLHKSCPFLLDGPIFLERCERGRRKSTHLALKKLYSLGRIRALYL